MRSKEKKMMYRTIIFKLPVDQKNKILGLRVCNFGNTKQLTSQGSLEQLSSLRLVGRTFNIKAIKQNTQSNSLNKLLNTKHLTTIKQKKDYSNLYALFQNKTKLPVSTLYSKMDEVKLVTIGLASANRIRQWAEKTLPNGKVVGEVTNANTLHHKTFKPLKGGLFCERIFGPLKDFECACGGGRKTKQLFENANSSEGLNTLAQTNKTQGSDISTLSTNKDSSLQSVLEHSTNFGHINNYKRFFCSKCDVEYTWSVIRRYQLGYIKLNAPVTHVWYVKGNPSYISLLLDMKKKHLEYVTYCTETLTLENSLKVAATADEFAIGSDLPQDIYAVWEKATKNNMDVNSSDIYKLANPNQTTNPNIAPAGKNVMLSQGQANNPSMDLQVGKFSASSASQLKPLNSKPKNWYYFNNILLRSDSLQESTLEKTMSLKKPNSGLQGFSNLKEFIQHSLIQKDKNHSRELKYVVLENTEWDLQACKSQRDWNELASASQKLAPNDTNQTVSQGWKASWEIKARTSLKKSSAFTATPRLSVLSVQSNLDDNTKLSPEIKYRNYLVKKEKTINYYKQLFKSGIIQSTKAKKQNYSNASNLELSNKAIAKQSYKTFYTLLTTELNTIFKNSSRDVMFNSYINNNNSAQISLFSQDKNSLSSCYFSNLNNFSLVGVHNTTHPFKVYWKNLLRQTYKAANTEATIRIESIYQLVNNKLQTNQTNNIVFTSLDQLLTIRKNLNKQINSLSNLLYRTMSVKTQKIKSLILKALGFRVLLASKTLKSFKTVKPGSYLPLDQSKKTVITGFKLSKIFKVIYMVWSNRNNNCISLLQNTLNNKPFVAENLLSDDLTFLDVKPNNTSFEALKDVNALLNGSNQDQTLNCKYYYCFAYNNLFLLVKSVFLQKNTSWKNNSLPVGGMFCEAKNTAPNTESTGFTTKALDVRLTEQIKELNLHHVVTAKALYVKLLKVLLTNKIIVLLKNLWFVNSNTVTKLSLNTNINAMDLALCTSKNAVPNRYSRLASISWRKPVKDLLNSIILATAELNSSHKPLGLASLQGSLNQNSLQNLDNGVSGVFYNKRLKLLKPGQTINLPRSGALTSKKHKNKYWPAGSLTSSLKTIVNNIYCLSHRELWEQEKDWYFFALYFFTAPDLDDTSVPAYEYRNYDFSLLNTFFSPETVNNVLVPNEVNQRETITNSPKEDFEAWKGVYKPVNTAGGPKDQNNLLNKKDKKTNLHVSYSGAGIIQTLLAEFDYFELKKMDKQNRILLYDLNIYLKKLKKSLAIGLNGAGTISQQLRSDMIEGDFQAWKSQGLPPLNEYSLNKKYSILQKEFKELCKQRDCLIRRTKLIRKIYKNYYSFSKSTTAQLSLGNNVPLTNPNQDLNLSSDFNKLTSMVLTVLPVLPPDLRPIVKMGSQIAASDLNRLYQRVIYRNDRLKKFLNDIATSGSYEMKYAQRLLQEAVDNLIQNGKSGVVPEKDARGRALKSLSDLLKGKQGRFRQYLLGKRVDYSGRSVIVVGPKLKLHECGIPKEMALELYLPFLIKRILNNNLARTVIGAKSLIKNNKPLVWSLLREIMKTCPVLLNRAPTLHRLGFQAFQPKLVDGRAILLHPLACPAFNADFDGDQMAVHVPITVEARTEAWKLMLSRNNLLSPATGEPLVLPSQDMVLGCYYLTTNSNFKTLQNIKGYGMYFDSFNEVLRAYQQGVVSTHSIVWVKWNNTYENYNGGQFTADQPIEIRINQYGSSYIIYSKSHLSLSPNFALAKNVSSNVKALPLTNAPFTQSYSNNTIVINRIIRTTPGKIIFNTLIQKAWQT